MVTRSGPLNTRPFEGEKGGNEEGIVAVTWHWYDTVLAIALCDNSWIVFVIIAVIVTLITYSWLKGGRGEGGQDPNTGGVNGGGGGVVASAVKTCGLRYLYKHVYGLY